MASRSSPAPTDTATLRSVRVRAWSLCGALLLAGGCRFGFDGRAPDASAGDDDALTSDTALDPDAAADAADAAADASLICPAGYNLVAGETSKYKAINNSTAWLAAEQACEAEGTHLWIPDTAAEKAQMIALLPGQNIWVGVTDRKVIGQWLRVTGGTATYLPWETGEPDLAALECTFVDSLTTQLADQDCGSGRRYVCECDGAVAMPSTY